MQKNFQRQYLILLLIPATVVILAFFFMKARGFFYICTNTDPAYFYLNDALNIALGKWAVHVAHPGSTSQVIGGLTIKIITLLKGTSDVEQEVLLNPEFYLDAINKVFILLNSCALFLLGFFTLKWTKNIGYSLLLQCAPFVSWQTFRVFVKVSPEPLSFFASVFLTILLLRILQQKDLEKKAGLYMFLFALIIGFGLATKLTYISMVFIPLFLLPGMKQKAYFLLTTALLFHVFIIPAFAHYDYLFTWAKNIFFHAGHYGKGPPIIVDFTESFKNIGELLFLHHSFFAIIAVAVTILLYCHFNSELRKVFQNSLHFKILIALTFSTVIHALIVAKHYNPEYMVPFFTLAPFLVFLLLEISKRINTVYHPVQIERNIKWKVMAIVVVIILLFFRHMVKFLPGQSFVEWIRHLFPFLLILMTCLVLSAVLMVWLTSQKNRNLQVTKILSLVLVVVITSYYIRDGDLKGLYQRLEKSKNNATEVTEFVRGYYGDYAKVFCKHSTSQLYALRMGASRDFPQPARYKKLQSIYGDDGIYFLDNYFTTWTDVVPLDSIIRQQRGVIFRGDTSELKPFLISWIEENAKVRLKNVYHGDVELVYKVEYRQ